jgi:hypothetical protein
MTPARSKRLEMRGRVYSAVLDGEPCAECERWDGVFFELDDCRVSIPNPQCTCAEGCHCYWVYVTDDDAIPQSPVIA